MQVIYVCVQWATFVLATLKLHVLLADTHSFTVLIFHANCKL